MRKFFKTKIQLKSANQCDMGNLNLNKSHYGIMHPTSCFEKMPRSPSVQSTFSFGSWHAEKVDILPHVVWLKGSRSETKSTAGQWCETLVLRTMKIIRAQHRAWAEFFCAVNMAHTVNLQVTHLNNLPGLSSFTFIFVGARFEVWTQIKVPLGYPYSLDL